ncbi:MAG: hypothetical protein DM484_01265 [Candidatus Methylumidiphilus alinenensis]|uniref:Uncharacterized protein n=1 Tax=Candidatus Methylumidiphilus alinenensis TaxID=2202197 RepID=A0A2W4TN76_9GAMM|nr:MAG: hypothetical protein DM484_01265 [Candidatus Methylumidiphilus alinenensis]
MTLTIAQTYRQSELNNYATQFGAAAQIAIFNGTAPTDADTAYSANAILVSLPYTVTTPFGSATAAKPSVITAAAITTTNVFGTGSYTATFFRSFAQSTGGVTTLTAGLTYAIQALGTTTTANWITAGLLAGTGTAVVGMCFIAVGGALTGSGTCFLMNPVEQGTVGAGSGDLSLNTVTLSAGGPLQITSLTRSM